MRGVKVAHLVYHQVALSDLGLLRAHLISQFCRYNTAVYSVIEMLICLGLTIHL